MKNILIIFLLILAKTQIVYAWGMAIRDSQRQPSESPTYYLGDPVFFSWDVNNTGWGASFKKAGIGIINSSVGISWLDIQWVDEAGDGYGGNEGIKSTTVNVNTVGTWYYSLWLGWGGSVGDNGRWYDGSAAWNEGSSSFISSTFTVLEIGNPTVQSAATQSSSSINLSWSRWNSKNVMVVRKLTSASWTEPTQGTAYSVGNSIGSGTVVYNGNGTSFTDINLLPATGYDYKFYSENYSYYSDGVIASATTATTSANDYFRSRVTGNWSESSTWESSPNNSNWVTAALIPGSSAKAITILNDHNVTLDGNVTIASLTINSGGTFTASDASPRTLTIAKSASGSSTTLANNGTWANGTGGSTVVFSGAPSSGDAIHVITGTIAFQNITINKTGGSSNVGASFGANSSVSGTLEIGAGGFVSTVPPTGFYGSNAILKFNQGTGANYNVEASDYTWSTTVIPNYITISSGKVNLNSARTASGNLLIDGGELDLNAGLTIQGNWTRTGGTFTPNEQTVTLSGANNSIISTSGAAILYNLMVSKTNGASVTAENGLTINNNLTINSGASLTVNGTLTNNAGHTGIVIKSDATGTGSLITSNGVGATVERYVAGDWSSATSGWHQISSPVAAQALSAFETSGTNNGYDLYGWDEPTNTWKNYKDAGFATWNGSANFNVGQGYMISYEANQTKTFTGALNVSNVTRNDLSNTGGFWYTGWHLVGNSFSSAVQWNNGSWALTDVAGTCKIWNSASKSYSDIAANGIIPSAQGFMIKVADATNSITIPASARVHNSTNWYKSGNQTEKFFLIAAEQSGLSAQESQILVNPDATPEYDFDFDSHFLAGYAPQFYSIAGDIKLSTNTLPSLPDDAIIPFGFVKNEATQFNITMQEQINGYIVYLNDLLTGVEHNLTDQPVYSFTSAEGDDPNRFLLYFAPVSVNKPAQGNAYGIYSYAGQVYISNTPSNAQITLSTLTGQVVMQRNAGGSGLVTLNAASLPKGVYIVTVQGEGARVSRKVVL